MSQQLKVARLRPPHRATALSLALCLLAFSATDTHAQATPNAGLNNPVLDLDLPAAPLAQTLNAITARSDGLIFSAAPALTEGRQAPAIRGQMPVEDALRQALAGSGLVLRRTASGALTVEPQPQSGVTTLGAVTVRGTQEAATEGTGSYTTAGPTTAATGLNLTLRQTPQSVSVMTRQRMDDFKLETLDDVLSQTPGVSVFRSGSYTEYSVRGSAVNLQTEGSRQISSGYTYFGGTNYTLDDLADIDRTEVLKGSAGLMTGYGSPGATVNMIRKRPTRDFQASASVGAGQWQQYRGSVDVSGPLTESGVVRGRLVAMTSRAHSFKDDERNDGQLLYGTAEADLTENTTLTAGVTYRRRKVSGLAMYQSILLYTPAGEYQGWQPRSFNPGASWSGYDQTSINTFARLEHEFSNGWRAKLQASHERITMPELVLGSYRDSEATATRYLDTRNINSSVAVDIQGPVQLLGRTHELLLGAGTARMHSSFGSNKFGDSDHRKEQSYAYGAGRFSLLDPLNLIVGLRVTNYENTDKTLYVSGGSETLKDTGVITPYAGLVFDLTQTTSLYASYARIFQSQGAQDEQGETLAPREGVTYEIGAKGEFFDGQLNASLSQFWMRTNNEAEATGQKTPGGANAYRPVNGVMRRGHELELSGEVLPGWQMQGSYVLNSNTLSTSSRDPKYQFKLGSTYRVPERLLPGLTIGGSVRWQSGIEASASGRGIEQPAYWVADAMVRYQLNQRLSLSLNVNNLFDKSYLAGITASGWEGIGYTWGAPRHVQLSARYQF